MKTLSQSRKKSFYIGISIFILIYISIIVVRQIGSSLLFTSRERINIIIYNDKPEFYSIGLKDNVNYKADFNVENSVIVPGGYGRYNIRAIGELARLEKKPDLIQRTFSSLTSSSVDFYFYTYKHEATNSLNRVLFYPSNASIIDRIILYTSFLQKKQNDFARLSLISKKETIEDSLFDAYQGYFYQKILRAENSSIQLIYSLPTSVKILSRIWEGEGLRVVDLAYFEIVPNRCEIIKSNSKKFIQTEKYFQNKYGCIIKMGDTAGQDMKVIIGRDIEKLWE